MELFYSPNIATEPLLPEEESAHCIRVLRHTTGDIITVTDGYGSPTRIPNIVSSRYYPPNRKPNTTKDTSISASLPPKISTASSG